MAAGVLQAFFSLPLLSLLGMSPMTNRLTKRGTLSQHKPHALVSPHQGPESRWRHSEYRALWRDGPAALCRRAGFSWGSDDEESQTYQRGKHNRQKEKAPKTNLGVAPK